MRIQTSGLRPPTAGFAYWYEFRPVSGLAL